MAGACRIHGELPVAPGLAGSRAAICMPLLRATNTSLGGVQNGTVALPAPTIACGLISSGDLCMSNAEDEPHEEGAQVSSSVNSERSPRFPLSVDAIDWCRAPHNLLLEGPRASTEATLRRLAPRLRGPVKWMRCGVAFTFPLGEVGALILWDVEALGSQEQTGLLAWIDAHPRTTIVSTTAHPLFACVARELFDAELYYRLNVLLLSTGMETSAHGPARDGAHAATILTVCSSVDRKARNPLLFGSREPQTQGKVAGGDNFVVGVTSDGHLDARKKDTATAKCTEFLDGRAARRLL